MTRRYVKQEALKEEAENNEPYQADQCRARELDAGVCIDAGRGRRGRYGSRAPYAGWATDPGDNALVEPKPGGLPDFLGLNTQQREQLKVIWTETLQGPSRKANSAKRSQLIKERDDALYNLLTDEQKQQYQKAMTDFKEKLAELDKEREKAFQDAVERTEADP